VVLYVLLSSTHNAIVRRWVFLMGLLVAVCLMQCFIGNSVNEIIVTTSPVHNRTQTSTSYKLWKARLPYQNGS